ncbi:hypothetical protein HYQ44_009134 [Verticillium longisporum]|nr:hypothetical protein HYQ44_009134 [Verticillium longisporum]
MATTPPAVLPRESHCPLAHIHRLATTLIRSRTPLVLALPGTITLFPIVVFRYSSRQNQCHEPRLCYKPALLRN